MHDNYKYALLGFAPANMSNTRIDTSILDVIKSGIMSLTAKEVGEKYTLAASWRCIG